MNLNYAGEEFEVHLLDDGTLDTVIEINDIEHRFSTEFAARWRDSDGVMSEEGIREMALLVIEDYDEEAQT